MRLSRFARGSLGLSALLLGGGNLMAAGQASQRVVREKPKGEKVAYDSDAAARGALTFKNYCVSCHGPKGEGDGPMADQLRVAPSDLTRLSRGGKYPFDRTYRVIDGREEVKGHGGSGMPVWGDAFKNSREGYSEEMVKAKITDLVHYLASLQKPTH